VADIVAERETLKSDGRAAMTAHSTPTITTNPKNKYSRIDFQHLFAECGSGAAFFVSFVVAMAMIAPFDE
jgi:hypothetical protein